MVSPLLLKTTSKESGKTTSTHDQRLLELLEGVLAVLEGPVGEELVDDLGCFFGLVLAERERKKDKG